MCLNEPVTDLWGNLKKVNSAIISNLQVNENLISVLEFTVDAGDQQQVEGEVAANIDHYSSLFISFLYNYTHFL